MCVLVCCTRICFILCLEARGQPCVWFLASHHFVLLRIGPELPSRLDWLVSEPQRSASVDLPTTRIQVHIAGLSMFTYES